MKATIPDRAKARDLMRTDLITLNAEATVAEAIRTFEEYHISGVPVVDGAGTVVGGFSVHDVARMDRDSTERENSGRGSFYMTNPLDEPFEEEDWFDAADFSTEAMGPEKVKDWMTHKVLAVEPDTPLAEVCKRMVRESVHRVLVMEDQGLVGLISSFDVVRFVAGMAPAKASAPSKAAKKKTAKKATAKKR